MKFWDNKPYWLFYLCHWRKIKRARKAVHSKYMEALLLDMASANKLYTDKILGKIEEPKKLRKK